MRELLISRLVLSAVAMFCCVMFVGCETTGKKVLTYNMVQSVCRSGGDVAMTALLDQGVDKKEAVDFCRAMIKFLEQGDVERGVFEKYITDRADVKYADYVDALLAVFDAVNNTVGLQEKIPPDVRDALISFLKDGAVYGAGLYKDDRAPKPEGENS